MELSESERAAIQAMRVKEAVAVLPEPERRPPLNALDLGEALQKFPGAKAEKIVSWSGRDAKWRVRLRLPDGSARFALADEQEAPAPAPTSISVPAPKPTPAAHPRVVAPAKPDVAPEPDSWTDRCVLAKEGLYNPPAPSPLKPTGLTLQMLQEAGCSSMGELAAKRESERVAKVNRAIQ